MKLRGEMDLLMKTCATDVWNQFNCVNNAFNARVLQTKNAIAKLHDHMQKVHGFCLFKRFQKTLPLRITNER